MRAPKLSCTTLVFLQRAIGSSSSRDLAGVGLPKKTCGSDGHALDELQLLLTVSSQRWASKLCR
jgi:hypothetical protein